MELRAATTHPENECLYEARFFVNENTLSGRFLVRPSPTPSVTVEDIDAAVPAWLLDFTVTLLRTMARSVQTNGYPRRLTRWRAGESKAEQ